MASLHRFLPILIRHEGGYVNHKNDKGGQTNKGVTLSTLRSINYDANGDGIVDAKDIRILSDDDLLTIVEKYYWNRWKADEILNQSVANILVDWVFNSGKWGIVIPQRILRDEFGMNIKVDGIVGSQTILAINTAPQINLFIELKKARIKFFEDIVKNNPSQKVFLKGWMNRVNSFEFKCNL